MHDGSPELLHRSRDGHFRPLWPIGPSGGETYSIIGDPRITELRIPKRSFWVLTRDPFDDASRIFASRGSPRLGETFASGMLPGRAANPDWLSYPRVPLDLAKVLCGKLNVNLMEN